MRRLPSSSEKRSGPIGIVVKVNKDGDLEVDCQDQSGLQTAIGRLSVQQEQLTGVIEAMSAKLDAEINGLKATVDRNTSVLEGATLTLTTLKQKMDEAIQSAIDNGATDAELAALHDLNTTLGGQVDALAAAVAANTPAAEPPATGGNTPPDGGDTPPAAPGTPAGGDPGTTTPPADGGTTAPDQPQPVPPAPVDNSGDTTVPAAPVPQDPNAPATPAQNG